MGKIFENMQTGHQQHTEAVNQWVEERIFYNKVNQDSYHGSTVDLNGEQMFNFFSCSYLGLEVHPRIKAAAQKAIERSGVQFSCSRAFVSVDYYEEVEELLGRIFGGHVLLTGTTTLSHYTMMPLIIRENDAVVLDQQVHNSMASQVPGLQSKGVEVAVIRHNDMEALEQKIKQFEAQGKRVWYMADGVYSMYGDYADFEALNRFLKEYENFYLYIDDAHGMSWTGERGSGSVIQKMGLQDKMVMTTSLSKGFGCGGGAIIVKDKKLYEAIKYCGSSIIFSGPIQTPILAALKESAHIHLSPGFSKMQKELADKIAYTRNAFIERGLPLISQDDTPISFLGVSNMKVGFSLFKNLINDGFLANLSVYPAVGKKATGLRFTTNLYQSEYMIDSFADSVAYHLDNLMQENDMSLKQIYQAFRVSHEDKSAKIISLKDRGNAETA